MKKTDLIGTTIPILVLLIVFFPICTVHYFYTDELVQLWLYKKGTGFDMFRPQGRLLTDWLFSTLFGSIDTVAELSFLRMISMAGWLLVIPVWYTILKRIGEKEQLPRLLPFFTTLYLAVSLPVSVSIQWASAMELFIAYTAGLIAGYLVWLQLDRRNFGLLALALVAAMISLFTYQNGFGCFMLPVFLHFLAGRRLDRKMVTALIFYIGAYIVYFLLFRSWLALSGAGVSERTALATDPLSKIGSFLLKALPGAFYLNFLVPETSKTGRFIYAIVLIGMTLLYCRRTPGKLLFIAGVFGAWMLIYLPSLIVKENYASNRTLLALDLSVFIWILIPVLDWADDHRSRMIAPALAGIALIAIARYNLHNVFLPPAVDEYNKLNSYIGARYHPGIDTVRYIRPDGSFVKDTYRVPSSWDEFGFSSSYFAWVPEYAVKQLIFEKTGDRATANMIHVITDSSAIPSGANILIVDVPAILRNP